MRLEMRKILLAAALAFMPITGCATLAATSNQEQIGSYDEKALLTAEVAYGAALSAINAAAVIGTIDANQSRQLMPLLEAANDGLESARALYDANRLIEGRSASESALLQVAAVLQVLIDAGIIE
jgi:hypothetical protein